MRGGKHLAVVPALMLRTVVRSALERILMVGSEYLDADGG